MAKHRKASMELTKKEGSRQNEAVLSEAPAFPFGLSVHLHDESLDKLNIEELPEVGAEFTMNTTVKATAVSEEETTEGVRRSVTLQITEMEIFHAEDDGEKLYGGSK